MIPHGPILQWEKIDCIKIMTPMLLIRHFAANNFLYVNPICRYTAQSTMNWILENKFIHPGYILSIWYLPLNHHVFTRSVWNIGIYKLSGKWVKILLKCSEGFPSKKVAYFLINCSRINFGGIQSHTNNFVSMQQTYWKYVMHFICS